MRRPVGVKWVLLSFRWTRFFFGRVATVATLPSALLVERFYSLGASWAFSFQPVLPPDYRPPVPSLGWKLGQAIDAVTETRLWALCLLPNWIPPLGCCRHGFAVVARRFVDFSAHPQSVQQDGQLSCGGDHGSFLPVLPATFSQFQAPAPQIAVGAKRAQNVMCSLHQQRSQIGISFLADVQLRFALPRVPPSWL